MRNRRLKRFCKLRELKGNLSFSGIAHRRQAIVDGYVMVLITQYFDTIKEIATSSKSSLICILYGPGAICDLATQIRDGLGLIRPLTPWFVMTYSNVFGCEIKDPIQAIIQEQECSEVYVLETPENLQIFISGDDKETPSRD